MGQTERNLIVNFSMLLGKNKLSGPEKIQWYTTLAALFEDRFKSLFFNIGKRRECGEVKTIP